MGGGGGRDTEIDMSARTLQPLVMAVQGHVDGCERMRIARQERLVSYAEYLENVLLGRGEDGCTDVEVCVCACVNVGMHVCVCVCVCICRVLCRTLCARECAA